MRKIVAGCIQLQITSGDLEKSVVSVEHALPGLAKAGCELAVLPEMWSSGFSYHVLRDMAAETPKVVGAMQEWARQHRMVLIGSLPEIRGDKIFNTSYVVDVSGEIAGEYQKIHLFTLHGEHLHFEHGNTPLVCQSQIGRIGVMICYDLRFPELARRLALDGAEIICVSALWPEARVEHWTILLRSRAVENQLFVVGCNGSGREGEMLYGGASAIVSPTGRVLAEAGSEEATIVATMDPADMDSFRRHIPCFGDRLPGIYGVQ